RTRAGKSEAELDELNARVLATLTRSGFAMISSTRVDGRFALRLCILNHRSSRDDVIGVLRWIEDCPV
ncbi:MAG: amino acid decarboxylase, partial [Deltaproteobacteria bacterium]